PSGDLKTLPTGATALDFAFEIHSDIGCKCVCAKVNHNLVPLSHELHSGDQVEILTSSKQTPKEDWINYVVTAKAKSKIKSALKEEKKKVAAEGKEILIRKFRHLKVDFTMDNINELLAYYKIPSTLELFYRMAKDLLDISDLREFVNNQGTLKARGPKRVE